MNGLNTSSAVHRDTPKHTKTHQNTPKHSKTPPKHTKTQQKSKVWTYIYGFDDYVNYMMCEPIRKQYYKKERKKLFDF